MDGGRYMYVAFMSQQAIEKLTKGVYNLYSKNEPPIIHNIWNIFKQLKKDIKVEEHLTTNEFEDNLQKFKSFFAELLSYYISGRYPLFKEKISSGIDASRAKRILCNTEGVFLWIKSLSQYKK